ncbi:MAG: four-carbon acid sugar kinase family protein [Burkholderiales bacterium]|nr:four-carbon acid sugar kinase family protein [Burkholderiales bacterium]
MLALGVIADDFTGATDVASMLVRGGLRTVQLIGVPGGAEPVDPAAAGADAVVVALKSRTTPADDAVAESLAAWRWLRAAGAKRCYFKYCSTFDSTPAGNIGPVTEALMRELGADFTIACPAFPENGRTIFRGHLFVGDQLLCDSGMRDHPLTPMRDANLVRVLQAQCSAGTRVGLLRYDTVAKGAEAVRARVAALRAEGVQVAIADALHDDDLRTLADGCRELPLLTAGSGLALGLPELYERLGEVQRRADAAGLEPMRGPAVVLSGSCSLATNAQVAHWRAAGRPARALDVRALLQGGAAAAAEQAAVLAWAQQVIAQGGPMDATVPLIYSTAPPSELAATQAELGALASGARVEQALAALASALAQAGVRRWVVAGGETSGAVVQALGVHALRIGNAICPGVPWTQAQRAAAPGRPAEPVWLALKSGNFGAPDFFSTALGMT